MTLIRLAIKNLLRKGARSIAIIFVGVLAAGLIFSASVVLQAARSSLELGIDRLGADIMVVPAEYELRGQRVLLAGEPSSFYMDIKNVERVMAVPGVKQASPQLFISSAVLECCIAPNVLLVGYEPKTDFTIKPWVRLSLQAPPQFKKLDPVILGGNLSYLSSSDVRYYGKQFWVNAVLHPAGLGFFDTAVFMTMDVARDMVTRSRSILVRPLEIGPDMISSVLVRVDAGYNIQKIAADIETSLPGVVAIRTRELAVSERRNIEAALGGVILAGLAFWVAMLIMMGLVFAMTVNERERELGILRAMGATRMHVLRLLVTEAVLLTGTGGAAGIGLAWIFIVKFKQQIIVYLGNIQFLWPSYAMIGTIGLSCFLLMLLSGAAAVLYPAVKSIQREPYDAIHRDR